MASATTTTESEQREAEEYWGYLISSDRTGTEQLQQLLRGLYALIGNTFEPSDSPDLTPSQLARFYRECNGDYDQLFIETPPSTIAFIYKNLRCVHSLQPPPLTSAANNVGYADPSIPALKLEGWVLWQTIQLLLAPDMHAEFLRNAVKKWDVKIPGTKDDHFPKLIPRSCFPAETDAAMQGWYDNMTEWLRRDMEEEEDKQKARKIRHEEEGGRPDSPMHPYHKYHQDRIRHVPHEYDTDEDSDSDSYRQEALAYFRNPPYRTVEGRPSVVRRASKRPGLDHTRQQTSFVQRGKTAAATVTRVVQQVASPHLWDGSTPKHHASASSHHSHSSGEDRRRKSLPSERYRHHDGEARGDYVGSSQNSPTGGLHPAAAARYPIYQSSSRRGSRQDSPPPPAGATTSSSDHYAHWNTTDDGYSPPAPSPRRPVSTQGSVSSASTRHPRQPPPLPTAGAGQSQYYSTTTSTLPMRPPPRPDLRHRKSHDPPTTPKEYFPSAYNSNSNYYPTTSHHGHSASTGTPSFFTPPLSSAPPSHTQSHQRPRNPSSDRRNSSAHLNVNAANGLSSQGSASAPVTSSGSRRARSPAVAAAVASASGGTGSGTTGGGPGGFTPSASPLFATHIARGERERERSSRPGSSCDGPSLGRTGGNMSRSGSVRSMVGASANSGGGGGGGGISSGGLFPNSGNSANGSGSRPGSSGVVNVPSRYGTPTSRER
ncbi:hypothetical protein AAFC00_006479 [Neodothiora populina]|uniref:DUF7514 domain-containing protein n=1 Tax=Neodothiora populina TaxID=2781224 RepID=A0ABR3P5J1_9PEZI